MPWNWRLKVERSRTKLKWYSTSTLVNLALFALAFLIASWCLKLAKLGISSWWIDPSNAQWDNQNHKSWGGSFAIR